MLHTELFCGLEKVIQHAIRQAVCTRTRFHPDLEFDEKI